MSAAQAPAERRGLLWSPALRTINQLLHLSGRWQRAQLEGPTAEAGVGADPRP